MTTNRRTLLSSALAAVAASRVGAASTPINQQGPPPGVPLDAILGGEKLIGIEFTDAERKQMAPVIAELIPIYQELRKDEIENGLGPAEVFDPRLTNFAAKFVKHPTKVRSQVVDALPDSDADIAFASLPQLGHWLRTRKLSSERLTTLYLDRLEKADEKLKCVITLTREHALASAKRADQEIAADKIRGPLHGIPYGIKDLFDTAGIRTTYGAEPFRERVPTQDSAVVERLAAAGAVLIAKLSLGALAYGDIWFGGTTKNPFKLDQGSSGSSAGSACATAAGLVGFSIGTETYGSIGSPSARCGATGLRPTFGRVSRFGAMALCWSLDKAGPICRSAEDCALVLDAIAGIDPRDESTIDIPLGIDLGDAKSDLSGLKVGYFAREDERMNDSDRTVRATLEKLGAKLIAIEPPQIEASALIWLIINVEAAAAFDRLTRDGLDDQLTWQADEAWPNTFRAARFIPAVEFQQARRLRRRGMVELDRAFAGVDAIVANERHGLLHALTNLTGHPAITLRSGFRDDGTPRGVTLWGRLFDENTLLRIASHLEGALGIAGRRPAF